MPPGGMAFLPMAQSSGRRCYGRAVDFWASAEPTPAGAVSDAPVDGAISVSREGVVEASPTAIPLIATTRAARMYPRT
jgi:hypothetical protein